VGVGRIAGSAADEFDFAVELFDKAGRTKYGDGLAGCLTKPKGIY
jgi:hypothetical protein